MNNGELRAAGSLAAVFAMRLMGLFMIYPVFAVYVRYLRGATPARMVTPGGSNLAADESTGTG